MIQPKTFPRSSTEMTQWSLFYEDQLAAIGDKAYAHFRRGLQIVGIAADRHPHLDSINQALLSCTGWKVYAVPGQLPSRQFFRLMAFRRFGLSEPHLAQQAFGHCALLADPSIATYLHQLARIAERFLSVPKVIVQLERLYSYTIQSGLVHQDNEVKIYGAAILTSVPAIRAALSPGANRVPFDLETILATPYSEQPFQPQYFVLDSIDQLTEAADDLDQHLRNQFG